MPINDIPLQEQAPHTTTPKITNKDLKPVSNAPTDLTPDDNAKSDTELTHRVANYMMPHPNPVLGGVKPAGAKSTRGTVRDPHHDKRLKQNKGRDDEDQEQGRDD